MTTTPYSTQNTAFPLLSQSGSVTSPMSSVNITVGMQPAVASQTPAQAVPSATSTAMSASHGPEEPVDKASIEGKFGWMTLDGANIPCLFRGTDKYVSVRMVEHKLLSRYPSTYPEELKQRAPLKSQYMTVAEAKLLNEINVEHCTSEFGQQEFKERDLIVTWTDFMEFYKIVKKYFPSEPPAQKRTKSTNVVCLSGGWVQVNNTVVPYVMRLAPNGKETLRLVPLTVIRYAANLLVHTTVPTVDPTEQECQQLTDMCKSAGLAFTFSCHNTPLILLTLLPVYSGTSVIIKQLPDNDPFHNAEYCPQLESEDLKNEVGTSTSLQAAHGLGCLSTGVTSVVGVYSTSVLSPVILTSNASSLRPGPQEAALSNGQPGVRMLPTENSGPPPKMLKLNSSAAMVRPVAASHTQVKATSGLASVPKIESQAMLATGIGSLGGPLNFVVPPPGMVQGAQGAWRPYVNNPADMKKLADMMNMQAAILSHTGMVTSGAQLIHQTRPTDQVKVGDLQVGHTMRQSIVKAKPEASATRPSQPQLPPSASPPSSILVEPGVRIKPIDFHGKKISCLVKDGSKQQFALVEAISRVYFMYCNLEKFLRIVSDVFQLSIYQLNQQEEQAFIRFYGLPTKTLKCNKVLNLLDLNPFMPQLLSMFGKVSQLGQHSQLTNKFTQNGQPISRSAHNNELLISQPVPKPAVDNQPLIVQSVTRPAHNKLPAISQPLTRPAHNNQPVISQPINRPAYGLHPISSHLVSNPAHSIRPLAPEIRNCAPSYTAVTLQTRSLSSSKPNEQLCVNAPGAVPLVTIVTSKQGSIQDEEQPLNCSLKAHPVNSEVDNMITVAPPVAEMVNNRAPAVEELNPTSCPTSNRSPANVSMMNSEDKASFSDDHPKKGGRKRATKGKSAGLAKLSKLEDTVNRLHQNRMKQLSGAPLDEPVDMRKEASMTNIQDDATESSQDAVVLPTPSTLLISMESTPAGAVEAMTSVQDRTVMASTCQIEALPALKMTSLHSAATEQKASTIEQVTNAQLSAQRLQVAATGDTSGTATLLPVLTSILNSAECQQTIGPRPATLESIPTLSAVRASAPMITSTKTNVSELSATRLLTSVTNTATESIASGTLNLIVPSSAVASAAIPDEVPDSTGTAAKSASQVQDASTAASVSATQERTSVTSAETIQMPSTFAMSTATDAPIDMQTSSSVSATVTSTSHVTATTREIDVLSACSTCIIATPAVAVSCTSREVSSKSASDTSSAAVATLTNTSLTANETLHLPTTSNMRNSEQATTTTNTVDSSSVPDAFKLSKLEHSCAPPAMTPNELQSPAASDTMMMMMNTAQSAFLSAAAVSTVECTSVSPASTPGGGEPSVLATATPNTMECLSEPVTVVEHSSVPVATAIGVMEPSSVPPSTIPNAVETSLVPDAMETDVREPSSVPTSTTPNAVETTSVATAIGVTEPSSAPTSTTLNALETTSVPVATVIGITEPSSAPTSTTPNAVMTSVPDAAETKSMPPSTTQNAVETTSVPIATAIGVTEPSSAPTSTTPNAVMTSVPDATETKSMPPSTTQNAVETTSVPIATAIGVTEPLFAPTSTTPNAVMTSVPDATETDVTEPTSVPLGVTPNVVETSSGSAVTVLKTIESSCVSPPSTPNTLESSPRPAVSTLNTIASSSVSDANTNTTQLLSSTPTTIQNALESSSVPVTTTSDTTKLPVPTFHTVDVTETAPAIVSPNTKELPIRSATVQNAKDSSSALEDATPNTLEYSSAPCVPALNGSTPSTAPACIIQNAVEASSPSVNTTRCVMESSPTSSSVSLPTESTMPTEARSSATSAAELLTNTVPIISATEGNASISVEAAHDMTPAPEREKDN